MGYSDYKKKGKKKSYKKKTYKKKAGAKRATKKRTTRYSASAVFAEEVIRSFTYFQTVYLDPADPAPLVVVKAFRCNSIHDPNFTDAVGDHQPRGHDEWAVLYNNYQVLESTITAKYQPIASRMLGAVTTNKTGLTITMADTTDMREKMNTKCKLLQNVLNGSGTGTTMTSKWTKSMYPPDINVKDMAGIMGNTGIGSNPTFQPRFDVWLAITEGLGDPASVPIEVKIIYKVRLFNRKKIDQS